MPRLHGVQSGDAHVAAGKMPATGLQLQRSPIADHINAKLKDALDGPMSGNEADRAIASVPVIVSDTIELRPPKR